MEKEIYKQTTKVLNVWEELIIQLEKLYKITPIEKNRTLNQKFGRQKESQKYNFHHFKKDEFWLKGIDDNTLAEFYYEESKKPQNDQDERIDLLTKSLNLNPSNYIALVSRGVHLSQIPMSMTMLDDDYAEYKYKRLMNAINDLKRAIQSIHKNSNENLDSSKSKTKTNLCCRISECYCRIGERENAIDYLLKANQYLKNDKLTVDTAKKLIEYYKDYPTQNFVEEQDINLINSSNEKLISGIDSNILASDNFKFYNQENRLIVIGTFTFEAPLGDITCNVNFTKLKENDTFENGKVTWSNENLNVFDEDKTIGIVPISINDEVVVIRDEQCSLIKLYIQNNFSFSLKKS